MKPRCRAILIAGATASGKSALALTLADKTGAVIVNADSMQVYRDLEIITARPGKRDEAQARHRLYGFVDGGEAYSTGKWLEAVEAELAALRIDRRPAIIVGGTGLYFKALEEGLSPIPDIPADIRARWRVRLEGEGAQTLHGELAKCDPASADALPPGDGQRIVRALEVLETTGKPPRAWHGEKSPSLLEGWQIARTVLTLERDVLYARCDQRFDGMIEQGGLKEIEVLAARGLSADLPVMKALGVPQLIAHIRGDMALEDAVDAAKRETRRYAKRQMTWFRGQMAHWPQLAPGRPDEMAEAVLTQS